MKSQAEITQLLVHIKEGSEEAYDTLFPLVYNQLKQLAHARLKKEYSEVTYSKTALVHEAYLKMVQQGSIKVTDRNHFFAISSRCMRQILIDHARKKKADKRGGEQYDLTYIDGIINKDTSAETLLEIDRKLDELAQLSQRMADIVELRFFGDMTIEATADVLDISVSTVKRDWAKARGWLYKELK
ncbi:sigma-70 family RNA polymerase sigma factor [Fodinibius halophilus]|uniref:Sigma-70 family RNA polymerase sigma factor n=1 Tax=Fodinibius halophilus TaxID=1736908 RepID=A0A6M1SZD9_9BACT|nr:sigma-70 family RNA polymerase sigma factor [Fodinibius halophilus]NGP86999.1 sigma-70 family RNA polymerase sigma factor [Fodinibius halophilus]